MDGWRRREGRLLAAGATDENGIEAVEGRVSIHDWHATILHLMGLDHERLTYPYAGRDFRLDGGARRGREGHPRPTSPGVHRPGARISPFGTAKPSR